MPSTTDRPLRILVVEDEQLLAMFLVDVVEDLGCEVVASVSSGEAAIKAAEQGFDLAFVDVGLAGAMDGIDTAVRLRESHKAAIVFTSGASGSEVNRRSQAAEPMAFLLKPFGAADVDAIVQRVIALRAEAT